MQYHVYFSGKMKFFFFTKTFFIDKIRIIGQKCVIPHPPRYTYASFFQSSKQLLKSISGIALNTFFNSTFISSIESKRCPQSGLLSLLNSHKSHGAKSGKYGGCGTIWVEFLVKKSQRTNAVWAVALSWCKNHELFAQNIF